VQKAPDFQRSTSNSKYLLECLTTAVTASRNLSPSLRDTSVNLQLLATCVYVRCRYDNPLRRAGSGVRFNGAGPAEVAIFVEAPGSTTAFPDLHSPVIAIGRNREKKCNRSRHNHSAQISNEECAYHFVSLHFPCSLIEARRQADCLFGRYYTNHEWTRMDRN
jgi:hypothetical protein